MQIGRVLVYLSVMITNHILLFIYWAIWCFLHSFLANESIKGGLQARFKIGNKAFRLYYNVFAFISLGLVIYYQSSVLSALIFNVSTLIIFIGSFLVLTGFVIMLVCISKYFRQMSGIKSITPVLITSGLNKFVRHPLYLGTFIFIGGLVVLFPTIANAGTFVIILVYTLSCIIIEEKKLVNIFGAQYIYYQQKVPMIIPFSNSLLKKFRV
ncbi:MAG: isoprenylcysteine carboxylmethyltransferase family protein [Ferruginibacter sp.]